MTRFFQRYYPAILGGSVILAMILVSRGLDFYTSRIVPTPVIASEYKNRLAAKQNISPEPIKPVDPAKFSFDSHRMQALFKFFDRIGREQSNGKWEYFSTHRVREEEHITSRYYKDQLLLTSLSLTASLPANKVKSLYASYAGQGVSEISARYSFITGGPANTDRLSVTFYKQRIPFLTFPRTHISGVYCEQYEYRYDVQIYGTNNVDSGPDYTFFISPVYLRSHLLDLQLALEHKVAELHAGHDLIAKPIYATRCSGGAGIEEPEPPKPTIPSSQIPSEVHQQVYELANESIMRNRRLIEENFEAMHAALIEAFPEWKLLFDK